MNPFIHIELKGYEEKDVAHMTEIFKALIACGGLTGVKGGQTILHFDAEGNFMGVQLSYFPWRRKKVALDR